MDTNKLLVFAAGVAVGYFVFTEMQKRKMMPSASTPAPAPSPGNLDPKVADCQNQLQQALLTFKGTAEAQAQFSDQFMSDCMSMSPVMGAPVMADQQAILF